MGSKIHKNDMAIRYTSTFCQLISQQPYLFDVLVLSLETARSTIKAHVQLCGSNAVFCTNPSIGKNTLRSNVRITLPALAGCCVHDCRSSYSTFTSTVIRVGYNARLLDLHGAIELWKNKQTKKKCVIPQLLFSCTSAWFVRNVLLF